MEDWLDFDYRQMPQIQNPMMGQMPWCQQQMMPYMPMQPQMQPPMQMQPTPLPSVPPTTTAGPDFGMEPGSPVQQDSNYIQGYLRTQIGKSMRVEFLIGTNVLTDRVGTLVKVGIDYIVLIPFNSNDIQMCDLYSIKFVEIFGAAQEFQGSVQPRTTKE